MNFFFRSLLKKQTKQKRDYNWLLGKEAYQKACLLDDKREFEQAILYFDIAIENGVKEAYERRGSCLQSLGYFIDSITDFTKAIELDQTNCNLYFCRGIAKHTIGELAFAIADKRQAIEYSKLKTPINLERDKKAKAFGANSATGYYEQYMLLWESDLEFDITMRDKYNKIKASGLKKDIEYANELLKSHTSIWEMNSKKRHSV